MATRVAAPPLMRITLVTETFPPEVNGAAGTLHRLVAGLSARGHRLVVVRPRCRAGRAEAPSPDGWEEWPVAGMPLPGYAALRAGLPAGGTLGRRWRARRPDVVHVATEGPLGLSAVVAARRLGIPVSSSFHTNFHTFLAHYRAAPLRRAALRYLRVVHNLTDRTLVPSATARDELGRAGFRNLGILGRGVDTDLFAPARRDSGLRRAWGAGPETPVVIHVGRLAWEKNLELLIGAFEAMRRVRRPAPRLVLVGDGPARRRLEREHPDYHFAGMRSGGDLARHYASGDLFLFPSLTETFGNVALEAMASGLVVLAFDYAAAGQHIRFGENGWLAPCRDARAFTATAAALMARLPEWPRVRRAARRTALALSWPAVVDEFERALREVGSGAAAAPAAGLSTTRSRT